MAKETKIKFKILALSANDKATEWAIKLKSTHGLTEALCSYNVSILIDEEYFAEKINDINEEITKTEANPDMFEDYKTTVRSLKDNIKIVENEKKDFEAMEIEEFAGRVEQVDFTKDTMVLTIQEAIVPDLIKLRHNVEAFVVDLK